VLENNYFELLEDIKSTLITTRNKVIENANKDLIIMYYNIGLKLIENNKWGSSFIDTLSKDEYRMVEVYVDNVIEYARHKKKDAAWQKIKSDLTESEKRMREEGGIEIETG